MSAAVIDETLSQAVQCRPWHLLVMHAPILWQKLPVVEAHELPGSNLFHQRRVRHDDVWPGTQKDFADGAISFWQVQEQVVVQSVWWSLQQASSTQADVADFVNDASTAVHFSTDQRFKLLNGSRRKEQRYAVVAGRTLSKAP